MFTFLSSLFTTSQAICSSASQMLSSTSEFQMSSKSLESNAYVLYYTSSQLPWRFKRQK